MERGREVCIVNSQSSNLQSSNLQASNLQSSMASATGIALGGIVASDLGRRGAHVLTVFGHRDTHAASSVLVFDARGVEAYGVTGLPLQGVELPGREHLLGHERGLDERPALIATGLDDSIVATHVLSPSIQQSRDHDPVG